MKKGQKVNASLHGSRIQGKFINYLPGKRKFLLEYLGRKYIISVGSIMK